MDSILAAARAGITVSRTDVVPPVEPKRQQFTVCGKGKDFDWRWPDGHPVWTTSWKEGAHWENDDLRHEDQCIELLGIFGLNGIAGTLPPEKLRETSPASLIALRREIESKTGKPRLEIRCQRSGGTYCLAEEAI